MDVYPWLAVLEQFDDNSLTKSIVLFNINDYDKLHELFGQLLRETQRIKSEGDFKAVQALVEGYGVKVDQAIHAEVLERNKQFKSAPYGGFLNGYVTNMAY